MQELADIIHQELMRLVPFSIIKDIACFVLYDNHPRDVKRFDITVCTKNGELREYFQRDLVSSINLKASSAPKEIFIMRNSESELFYIVSSIDEFYIVSTKRMLEIHTKITNVDKYTVDDSSCTGQTFLKVTRKDDAVPLIFDENFSSGDVFSGTPKPDSSPLFFDLKKKFVEAQYNVRNHEKTIAEYIKLRHAGTWCAYQDIHPSYGHSIYKSSSNVFGALKVKTQKPWIKVCNRNVIIALKVLNEYKEPLEEIHILLNSPTITSLSYTSKIFKSTEALPFWTEQSKKVLPNCETTVVGVISLDKIKPSVTSKIVVTGALSYKTQEKTYLMPFDTVIISSMETFGDEFDAMSSSEFDANTMLAILSTTEHTDLRMRLIKSTGETLIDLLTKHLQMDRVGPNVIVYNKSPYHALNGAMLHFTGGTDRSAYVSAYTRTKSQLLTLIHTINDAVPATIIITTPNYIISAKTSELSEFSEQEPTIPEVDYLGYAETVINRTGVILEYLDRCMIKMGESKSTKINNKIGTHIDLYACGKIAFKEFKDKIIEETNKGVECLEKNTGSKNADSMDED